VDFGSGPIRDHQLPSAHPMAELSSSSKCHQGRPCTTLTSSKLLPATAKMAVKNRGLAKRGRLTLQLPAPRDRAKVNCADSNYCLGKRNSATLMGRQETALDGPHDSPLSATSTNACDLNAVHPELTDSRLGPSVTHLRKRFWALKLRTKRPLDVGSWRGPVDA
jgi:hypothetical protein